jgi:hypothetical protein
MSEKLGMILLFIGIFFTVGLIICLMQINDTCNSDKKDIECNIRLGTQAVFFIGTPSGLFLSLGLGSILRDKKHNQKSNL